MSTFSLDFKYLDAVAMLIILLTYSGSSSESSSAGILSTRVWLHKLYDKNKDPEPLFVLDLILKQGHLIPTYSTNPE